MTGVDTTLGFVPKILAEILSEIQTSQLNNIDPGLDFSTEKALGQLNGVLSEREALLWELLRLAYTGFDPDAAEGYLLEALCALTGTVRRAATRSLVSCTVNLDASTTLPLGSLASVIGQPTKRFRSVAAVTSTAAGDYTVDFEGEDTGPVAALAGTLTTIAAPVAGWNSITNPTDAALGRVQDTDATLRQRRADDLSRAGACTPDAIRADVLALTGMETVSVFENLTDYTDSSGLPAHSIEVLCYDGAVPSVANDTIAQAIWDTKAPGRTYGNTSGTATDSEGVTHTVYFSRPVEKAVYVSATVKTSGPVPADAATLLRDHLVTAGNVDLKSGVDVVEAALLCLLMDTKKDLGYSWLFDVQSLTLGFAASPALSDNLTITNREIARLDTSRTVITIAP